MKLSNLHKLRDIANELIERFDMWDERINAKQQPVPIQDIDFWATTLKQIINDENTGLPIKLSSAKARRGARI